MRIFLKITGLVALYLTVVVTGLLISFPELSEAILKGDEEVAPFGRVNEVASLWLGLGEIFAYEIDGMLAHPSGIPEKAVSVFITPHHLVADKQMRDGFAHVAAARRNLKTRRIILMGPNHFFRGKAKVITTKKVWQTNYGELAPDRDFIDGLVEQNLVALEEGILPRDHSITALLPFIEKFFPDAEFVPLMVREPMKRSDTKLLADFFHKNLTPEDLIIASIDFSHYFPKEIADAHDRESLAALKTIDIDFFEKKIDADARQILMIFGDYLKSRGHTTFTLLAHTNSAILMANPHETSTTSHFVGYYSGGKPTVFPHLRSVSPSTSSGSTLAPPFPDFAQTRDPRDPRLRLSKLKTYNADYVSADS